jgi:hypothetical protein
MVSLISGDNMPDDDKTLLLRHTLATLAYRGGKALRGAPAEFSSFRAGPDCRTPGQILAHLGDLLDWAVTLVDGKQKYQESPVVEWNEGVARFFAALEALDRRLASTAPLEYSPEKLFQGPIADSLTHVGQIAMLRRMAGLPMRGENYYVAEISTGRVGADQAAARREFD